MKPREWSGMTYDRISTPMRDMAMPVLDRLVLVGDETVIDAGCGSGRVTQDLLGRLPRGEVIALDGSQEMLAAARERLGDDARVTYRHADVANFEVAEPVDAVLSTATFHWVADRDALFRTLHRALRPGGQLVAQCGGHGNVARVTDALAAVLEANREIADHLAGFDPWTFSTPEQARARLESAGFSAVEAWLEPHDVVTPDGRDWVASIMLGGHLERLPEALHERFLDAIIARLGDDPLTIGYVRLNLLATA